MPKSSLFFLLSLRKRAIKPFLHYFSRRFFYFRRLIFCVLGVNFSRFAWQTTSEFDFDEAVKKFIIFQHEFSLPCEIKDLGNNFSLDEHPNWVVLGNVISSNLYYMNKKIGTVNISESGDKEQIICLDLGFGLGNETITDEALRKSMYDSYGWYSEEIEIDFNELDFNSSANEIRRCLGVPTEKTDDYFKDFLVYEYPNGYVWVKFFQGMITEFVIGLL